MTTDRRRDYYETLEVPRDASEEVVRRAYRRKAMEYHPDRNKSPDATQRFQEISEAYQVLSDPQKRQVYDLYGHTAPRANGGPPGRGFDGSDPFAGLGDIFDAFFGEAGGRGQPRPLRGDDQLVRLTLPFQDAVFGTSREVELVRLELCQQCRGAGAAPGTSRQRCTTCRGTRQVRRVQQSIFGQFAHITTCTVCLGEGTVITSPCTRCRGAGRERRTRRLEVLIPAGVEDGSQLRLAGEGDAGAQGGGPGDLYVQLTVEPHPSYQRQGNDLLYLLPINLAQAALGETVTITSLDGKQEVIKVPAGTQSGTIFRIPGKGVPHLHRGGKGDLRVVAQVVVPKKLTKRQRQLLEELGQTLAKPPEEAAAEVARSARVERPTDP